ncbi:MAG: hypothetical protein H0T46_12060 [Deltaproteobacteria bacterium]|nr:hypothetical protein [Deltaproteobacteria bacterium]
MRALWTMVGLLVAGCAPSLTQANRDATTHNEKAVGALERRVAEAGTPFVPPTVEIRVADVPPDPNAPAGAPRSTAPLANPAASAGAHGLVQLERLYRVDGQLAFMGGVCVEPASCGTGCGISALYRYARAADGRVVILRLRPSVRTVRIEVDQCGDDCGGGAQPPPEPAPSGLETVALLGVSALDQVEVRELRYSIVRVDTWCANPIPRP